MQDWVNFMISPAKDNSIVISSSLQARCFSKLAKWHLLKNYSNLEEVINNCAFTNLSF